MKTTTTYVDVKGATGDYVRMNTEDKSIFKNILERIYWDENGFSTLDWKEDEPVDEYGNYLSIESVMSGMDVVIDFINEYGIFDAFESMDTPMEMSEARKLHRQLLELKNKYGANV